jgi:hypothetical protein
MSQHLSVSAAVSFVCDVGDKRGQVQRNLDQVSDIVKQTNTSPPPITAPR